VPGHGRAFLLLNKAHKILYFYRNMSKFLIAGLGNIGSEYAGTRHNIGFDVLDALAGKHGMAFRSASYADRGTLQWKGNTLVCIKPSTYMNLSGKAVKYWKDKEDISLERILVIVDEVALPLEKFRLRGSGSTSGHNGLFSIQEELATTAYARLRFGIGNHFPKGMQIDYVLGKWTKPELPLVLLKVEKSVEIIEYFVTMGLDWTMNHYNKIEVTL
jgi:PTH1 family peptidyl-tRNA hydrolase